MKKALLLSSLIPHPSSLLAAGGIPFASQESGHALRLATLTERKDVMATPTTGPRFTLLDAGTDTHPEEFARDVRAGLTANPKHLSCRYFYDREGSQLFEEICRLPEYYLTRAETEILRAHAPAIIDGMAERLTLVELGSGSAVKTRLLIEAALSHGGSLRYVPIDISTTMLEESCLGLLTDYPALQIVAVAGEYREGLRRLKAEPIRPKLVLWLGSNVGNFDRPQAADFLGQVRATLSSRDRLLVGIDLRKDRAVLERAYDDARGVTARFNANILVRINRELGGHFDLGRFRHRAVYDEAAGRIEMYLVSTSAQRVAIDALGLEAALAAGEAIHTENSYKYSPAEIQALAASAGLTVARQWFDAGRRFSLNLLAPARA
jgi:L-histidine N-alpha-methyltransferase